MLPKIVVASTVDRDLILDRMEIPVGKVMGFEGNEGKIDDLRHWVNFATNVVASSPEINLVVWDADKLSPECQAILLKPLEESGEKTSIFLVTTNENTLLPTILSRCLVVNYLSEINEKQKYWKEIMECITKGPAKALSFSEEISKEEMMIALTELIEKLKTGLESGVNKNRLKVLKKAIDCLEKIKFTNVNAKLAFSNFLISSWKLIKA